MIDQQLGGLPADLLELTISPDFPSISQEDIENVVVDLLKSPIDDINDCLISNSNTFNYQTNNDWLSQYNYTPDTQMANVINRRFGGSYKPPLYQNSMNQPMEMKQQQGYYNQQYTSQVNYGTHQPQYYGNGAPQPYQQTHRRTHLPPQYQQSNSNRSNRKRKLDQTDFYHRSAVNTNGNNYQSILASILSCERIS